MNIIIIPAELPPLWWLQPWRAALSAHSNLNAVGDALIKAHRLADDAEAKIETLQRERDRAIIQANKWRFKYEAQSENLNTAIDEAFDDFIGDSDYLR